MARIGVFLCHCGSNIAGTVDIPKVIEATKKLPQVVHVEDNKFTCSEPGQSSIRQAIIQQKLTRVVIGACSPRMHEVTFRKTVASVGLNPYLLEIANLREHCSWVHSNRKEEATVKAIDIVRKAVARVRRQEPLISKQIGVTKRALVIGGGIAGIQASLDIANAGYEVVLVERQPSIGGRMAQLDKTFPTLDCSACILTPKMTTVGQHLNIKLMSYSQVEAVSGHVGDFQAKIRRKARYVDTSKCTGCGECAKVCPVTVKSEFDENLSERKAVYIPFPQAIPNKYTIDKRGYPPCRFACPAGVDAQGYIALISQSKFKEALEVVRRTMPFAGVCGRVCNHPCQRDCERGIVDEPIAIASLKRFIADYEIKTRSEKVSPIPRTKEAKIAIVGSGPAGLACAYDLVRKGYAVTVFEAMPQAGGLLRYGIPEYRLPKSILDREIDYIKETGVEIKTSTPVEDIGKLFEQGYKAVFLATGASASQKIGIPGEDSKGVIPALDFLKEVNSGARVIMGEKVLVIGGGSVAIDSARVVLRLGSREVHLVCLESRDLTSKDRMLAQDLEIEEAEEEGLIIHPSLGPKRILTDNGKVIGLEARICAAVRDEHGRFAPKFAEGPAPTIEADTIIVAIGQRPDVRAFEEVEKMPFGTIKVDGVTLETNINGVFAGGDVVAGPTGVVVESIAAAKEAAISIERYLEGIDLKEGRPKTVKRVKEVSKEGVEKKARSVMPLLGVGRRKGSFAEVELGFDETAAITEAKRCLNCAVCSECLECEKVCEAKAINHDMQDEVVEENVGAIVVATGVNVSDYRQFGVYGGGVYPDVISSLQLERMMSAAGPTTGEVIRPSNGAHPKSIVFIGCVGSRDERTGKGYCSKVCCMYMAKHAVMLKEHDPEVHSYILYPDIRGPGGKIFEEFLERAEGIGTTYLRGRIDKVSQGDGRLLVSGQDLLQNKAFSILADLVVLATGLVPSEGASKLAQTLNISYDAKNYLLQAHPKLRPVETFTDGIFLAGCAIAPTDIPESVAQGGAAAENVLKLFSHDVIDAEPMSSIVDITRCSGCLLCVQVCPFKAVEAETMWDGRTVASINESLCKGCGICVTACRPGAIKLRGFSDQQLLAEVMAL